MFNEILNRQASLEPTSEAKDPYREQGVLPPIRHACIACGSTYEAPAGSVPARCGPCHLAMVESNQKESAALHRAQEEHARKAANSQRLVRWGLMIAIAVGAGLFKYGMRTQMREDAAVGAGYSSYDEYTSERDRIYPTDNFSRRTNELADQMCRCSDLACARDVRALYSHHVGAGGPTDDTARASAAQDNARLDACQARFE